MESRVMGGSLPVANVQDLAAKKLETIPQRYVRPELKSESVVEEQLEIPVIDFSKLNIPQFSDSEMAKLHSACEDWGFFQLVNHGVSEEVTESMKIEVGKFFELSLEEKMACSQLPHTIEGYGQAFILSEEQKLDWGDMLFIITQPTAIRNFRFWPACPATFRETLDKYSRELQGLAIHLLGFIAENLGIDENKLSSMFEEGVQGVRMNYYPPCPQANQVLGISPHSDAVALTLLLQANEIQGLQIRKNAIWVPVIPIPGAFIVNVGDIVELSNPEPGWARVEWETPTLMDVASDSKDDERYFPPGFTPTRDEVMSLRELMKEGVSSIPSKFQQDFVKSVNHAEDGEIVEFFRDKFNETTRKDEDTNYLTHQNIRRSPRIKKKPAKLSDLT